MSNKIRILRIITRLNIGGPAIQAVNLTKRFSNNDYESLLVCGRVGSYEGDMSYLADESGVKPVFIPELGREISPINDIISFIKIRNIIKRYRPHIIHTHTAKAGALGRLSALSLKGSGQKPVLIHTFHGHVFHGYFRPIKSLLFIKIERTLARVSSRIIVISPAQRDEICSKYRISDESKVRIIPLGFDLSPFETYHSEADEIRNAYVKDDQLLIGMVGRLTAIKNHNLLINALKILKEKDKINQFRFIVIGDGELKEELINKVRVSGLDEYIKFIGWKRFMPPWYQAMDGVILTSLNEGTPVSIIEAMASGRPVIATDVGGVRDLFGDSAVRTQHGFKITRYGLIVPSDDADILADAILYFRRICDNIKESFSEAEKFVYKRFSLDRLVKDLDMLYKESLSTIR